MYYIHAHQISHSPDHIHGNLLPWGWGEGGQAHHLGQIPQRLLQVAALDVALQVGQSMDGQIHWVVGHAQQIRPFPLCPDDPVIPWVHLVLVELQVLTGGVWLRDCVRLREAVREEEIIQEFICLTL